MTALTFTLRRLWVFRARPSLEQNQVRPSPSPSVLISTLRGLFGSFFCSTWPTLNVERRTAQERPFNSNKFHYNWHWRWDTGNGDIGSQGVHEMDKARWYLGKNELPNKILSIGGRFGYEDDGETPNTQIALFDYGDSLILFEVRGLETQPYRGAKVGVVFHCADGYMVFSRSEAVAFDKAGEQLKKFTGAGDHFKNFTDAIVKGKPDTLAADVEKGHLSSALCHLGNISYRLGGLYAMYKTRPFGENEEAVDTFERFKEHMTANDVKPDTTQISVGKVLTIDPKTETIVGDPEASKLLTREYRKPYVVPEKV